ncbi:MAG: cysteine desulfurase NifS [Firmicutes bacterium]|nr:cysteine desulfurase NifS [Bacillota bacterium]
MRKVYMDYSATTPVKKEVLDEMLPYYSEHYGNPSSLYDIGADSKGALDLARSRLAKVINSKTDEVFFTSCGSEADNWALFGVADALKEKGNHIITTSIEHHAILHSGEYLEKHGFEVTYLPVKSDGTVDLKEFEDAITDKTILASIMYVNNEVGTVQPIKELAEIAHSHGVVFHTDAVQALGNVDCDVEKLGVDLMSMSGHKIYAPKGVGALYIRKGTKINNFLYGGAQEAKHRAGTENVAGIVAFGKAAEMAGENFESHVKHCSELRDYMMSEIEKRIPDVYINGNREHRHPGNCNVTFKKIEGESILLMLNYKGISVSTGSACSSKSLEPSHVLTALGVNEEDIHGTIRFTVGDFTTKEDVDYVLENLEEIVARLREISAIK